VIDNPDLTDAIAEGVLTPVRLEAMASRLARLYDYYMRAAEFGHFATHQPPKPHVESVVVEGYCNACDKRTNVTVDVTLDQLENWLAEQERKFELIAKAAEADARVALETVARANKPKKGKRR
jgi:ribosomal protein L44E